MSARLFLRRLSPVGNIPRTLVCGVLIGDDAIGGPDDQLAIDEYGLIGMAIQSVKRGECELVLGDDGVPTPTIGRRYETVLADFDRARIKGGES